MRVFLSYASEDRELVEPIVLALRAQGHSVFFDRDDLPPAEEFDGRIRKAESFAPGDVRNPKGPESGTAKVIRGGGWHDLRIGCGRAAVGTRARILARMIWDFAARKTSNNNRDEFAVPLQCGGRCWFDCF
jgi:hypothetical protein